MEVKEYLDQKQNVRVAALMLQKMNFILLYNVKVTKKLETRIYIQPYFYNRPSVYKFVELLNCNKRSTIVKLCNVITKP